MEANLRWYNSHKAKGGDGGRNGTERITNERVVPLAGMDEGSGGEKGVSRQMKEVNQQGEDNKGELENREGSERVTIDPEERGSGSDRQY